ncbi:MAG TPA: hypothetical protein VHC47_00755, partial [Mucilaginibacter sp.]|nr:hypothetical protein [Mucilaginibacter sp.]
METINSLSARSLQYYVISKRWSSDLQFFKFETGFLRRLLDEHFFSLNDKVGIEKVRQINNELLRLDVDKNQ